MDLTHDTLTALAVKWLRRPQSRKGPGCHIAVSECRSGWTGEIPDAIGWRAAGYLDGSVVVEVKVSRSDFLADSHKPHRAGETVGLGNWRYYLCPEGLIEPGELPPKWGLLYANKRGHIKPQVGPVAIDHYSRRMEAVEDMRQESDYDGERFILVKLFNRLGDVEEANQKMRIAWRAANRLQDELNDTRQKHRESVNARYTERRLLRTLREKAPDLVASVEAELDERRKSLLGA